MARQRDHHKEYLARVERARKKGFRNYYAQRKAVELERDIERSLPAEDLPTYEFSNEQRRALEIGKELGMTEKDLKEVVRKGTQTQFWKEWRGKYERLAQPA